MKVALVHYWLTSMRGGEKVLEELCLMFPDADIFTHVYDANAISATIRRHAVHTTLISRLPFAKRFYKSYLPLMPMALEQLDLRAYELVISSESGPAMGVLTGPGTVHICYCHTPMRYIWNMYLDYRQSVNPFLRPLMAWISGWLRRSDHCSANRVDLFLANSNNIKGQIRKYYGRNSQVVYPPVDVDAFEPKERRSGEFYLAVGQLVRYKRMDLAIEACNYLKRRLVIIGEGEEYKALRRLAGPTVSFLGRQDFSVIRDHYSSCKALVFPGEEDFGIVPVEAMACGKPVIAFGRGGAMETVIPYQTGIFFDRQERDSLAGAILQFEKIQESFDPDGIAKHARKFSKKQFRLRMRKVLEEQLNLDADRAPVHVLEKLTAQLKLKRYDTQVVDAPDAAD